MGHKCFEQCRKPSGKVARLWPSGQFPVSFLVGDFTEDQSLSLRVVREIPRIRAAFDLLLFVALSTFLI